MRAFFAALTTTSVLIACGGGSSGNNGGGTTGGGTATSSAFVGEYCGLIAPICCAKVGRPTDGTSCQAFWNASVGRSTYDPAKGAQCITELRAVKDDPRFCDDMNTLAPACELMTDNATGSIQPGEVCTAESDCAPNPEGDVQCVYGKKGTENVRTCQVQKRGSEGSTPCIETDDDSGSKTRPGETPPSGFICHKAAGLYCDEVSGACAKAKPAGATCATAFECAREHSCNSQKQCAPFAAVGADCTAGIQCVSTARCDTTTKKCIETLKDGSDCSSNESCASKSCVNGKCELNGLADLAYTIMCGPKPKP